jgi:two-component system, chemotaxis family, chemotaxis protein CheY
LYSARPAWIHTERFHFVEGEPRAGDHTRDDVMLIDSDIDAAHMYALGLNLSGYPVHVVDAGDSALRQVANGERPSLIVLDLEMPRMAGLEVLKALRSTPATDAVPILVLSNEETDFSEAYSLGAAACLTKYKTTPDQLVSYVTAAIRAGG